MNPQLTPRALDVIAASGESCEPIFRERPGAHETRLQSAPVCPHCGHVHRDAWEWNFGPGLEGTREVDCDSCGGAFSCEREVTVYYSTAAIAAAGEAA
jgi:hypothetical protein